MYELYVAGVKADAPIGIRAWGTVFQIAANGQTDGSELATYLVVSPCVEAYFNELQAFRRLHCLGIKYGELCPRCFAVKGISAVLSFVACQIVCQSYAFFQLRPFFTSLLRIFCLQWHDGVVGLFHIAPSKHIIEPCQCL